MSMVMRFCNTNNKYLTLVVSLSCSIFIGVCVRCRLNPGWQHVSLCYSLLYSFQCLFTLNVILLYL